MKIKRQIKRLACRDTFQVKKLGKDTYIQGWANKAVVDRGKDLIKTDAWNLENFKKVPTILFNHDKNKPIGKAVDVRPTDQGLWIKAKISNSSDPEISKIRDLVNEGMLNAFSVGFDSQNEEKDADGVNNISQAELYEVSVVTLPMNQDSTFDVTSKSLHGLSMNESRSAILKAKGAWLAEALQSKIFELETAGEPRDGLLERIATCGEIDRVGLQKIIAGDITPVSEKILGAFSSVLGLDYEDLKTLDAGDQQLKTKAEMKPNEEEDCMKSEDQYSEGGPEGDNAEGDGEDPDDDGDEDEGIDVDIISITIPKSVAATADAAKQMAVDAGYDAGEVQDAGDNWVIMQNDPEDFGSATGTIDLGDGVTALVGIRQGADPDAAEDAADTMDMAPGHKPKPGEKPMNPPPSDNPPHPEDDKPVPLPGSVPPALKPGEPASAVENPTPSEEVPNPQWQPTKPPVDDESAIEVDPAMPKKPKQPQQMSEEEMAAGKKPPIPPHPAAADAAQKPPVAPSDPGKEPPKPSAPPEAAPHQPHSEDDAPQGISEDQAKTDYQHFKVDEEAAVSGSSSNPPSWVADASTWDKAKEASQAALGKVDYAFLVWWYMQNGGTKKGVSSYNKKDGISGGGDAQIAVDDNPYLAQARQTNVLLGVLIEEFRQMCASMQGQAIAKPPAPAQEPKAMEDESMEMEKIFLENADKFLKDIEQKLRENGA